MAGKLLHSLFLEKMKDAMSENLSAASAGTITIGDDLVVNRIGLGTNRVSDTETARTVLKRAIELGINFIDTADVYQNHASEQTVGSTLAPYPKGVVIATKGGFVSGGVDGSPEYLRTAIEGSLQRLKLKQIALYQLHRVDPHTPIETSVSFLKQMQDEGKIKHIGLSEVTVAQLEKARSVAPIASVQNRYSLIDREHDAVVEYCEKNNMTFIPFTPLNKGNLAINHQVLSEVAAHYDISPIQLAISWLLKRSPVILPIPGTLSVDHLAANVAAASINLSGEDYHTLNKLP